ncbi:MAG: hypothetical protein WBV47_11835, partial [Salegentibacter sp.]
RFGAKKGGRKSAFFYHLPPKLKPTGKAKRTNVNNRFFFFGSHLPKITLQHFLEMHADAHLIR